MSGSLDQFGKSLVGSGLFTADELKAFWAALPAEDRPRDSETFSKLLVAQGKLTEFQARHVAAGNSDPLVLGDYVLLDKIGAGGMGQVFKAQHKRLKRLVAVKLLPPEAVRDAASIKRFQREVEAAGRVSHPNVVQAHDAGEHRGRHYLVMEYVAGSDLASLVRRHGPLPVDHAVACVLQAARGLEHAHAKGLIHRDIKPANLLIDERGTVKVLDLGLARFEDVLGTGGDDGLTGTGNIMGTVDFMSPEQALDTKHADARADVYSLGCTLYFLLTAKKPYEADTVMKRLMAHRESPIPSLREARPEVPAAVDEVYGRMMAKRPEARLQTMEDVCRELEACMPEARSILGETSPSAPNKSQSASGSSSSSGERLRAFLQGLPSGGTTSVGTPPQIAITVGDDTQGSHNPAVHTESVRTLPSGVPAIEAKAKLTSTTKPIKPAARRAAKRRRLMRVGGGAALALVAGIGLWKFNAEKIEDVGDNDVDAASVAAQPPVAPRPPLAKAPFDAKLAKLYQAAWARHLGTQVQSTNPVGMTLALIPPGEFLMGTSDAEIQAAKEHAKTLTTAAGEAVKFDQFEQQAPQHPVRLTRPYRMSTTETTVAQFRGFVEATGYKTDVEASGEPTRVTRKSQRGFDYLTGEFDWRNPGRTPADEEAVVLVSRADAVAFCNWLSRTESLPEAYVKNNAGRWVLLDGAAGYRLPTEAEWEYACRAGSTTAWWWGDDERQSRSWENIDGTGNSAARNPANPFGLNDMAGNVMEWCDDLFAETYPSRELRIDPPPGAVGSRFVARGANFTSKPVTARSATRFGYVGPMDTIGFRVVRTIATPAGDVSSAAAAIDMTPVADAPGSPQTAPPIAKAPFDAKQAKAHREAWAQFWKTNVEETNSLGMPMVLVPPSEFTMGTSDEEIAAAQKYAEGQPSNVAYNYRQFSLSGPQHRVTLSRPFRIAEMETTVAQFRRFCEATSYVTAVEADGKPNRGLQLVGAREYVEVEGDYSWHDPGWKPLDAQPVVLVTWEDAVEFCNWLSRSEGLPQAYVKDGTGRWGLMEGVVGYRLPTEAEWECACRAGTTSRFWWGDDEQGRQLREHLNCELSEVGRTMPNPLGLYDMGGNVSEWCQDTFRGPYPSAEHVFDPIEQSPDDRRVVRGGQYRTQTIVARSARRGGYEEAYTTIGFRVVRTIGPPMEDLTSAAATNKTPVAHAPGSPQSAPPLAAEPFDWKQAHEHQQNWAKYLGTTREVVNSAGAKLLLIPPGEFLMGSTDDEITSAQRQAKTSGYSDDASIFMQAQFVAQGPKHPVRLTRAYYLAATETTFAQFQEFVEATGYVTEAETNPKLAGDATHEIAAAISARDKTPPTEPGPAAPYSWRKPGWSPRPNEPVVLVSWNDAAAYCNWLSVREGLPPTYVKNDSDLFVRVEDPLGYRLPTEAEWEYACRAGTRTPWWWGADERLHPANEVLRKPIAEVATLNHNAFGLFDMGGNVSEWCEDFFHDRYPTSELQIDPIELNRENTRVIRGGNFHNGPSYARSARRHGTNAVQSLIGFRVARTVPPPNAVGSPSRRDLADPNRACAEWVLSIGGKVTILRPATKDATTEVEIADAAQLPGGPVVVTGVDLRRSNRIVGSDLERFAGLRDLKTLNLELTDLPKASLEPLAGLMELRRLLLGSGIADDEVRHLAQLKNLESLTLKTSFTDYQIKYLTALRSLKSLHAGYTELTDGGLKNLVAQLPELERLWLNNARKLTAAATVGLRNHAKLKNLNLNAVPVSQASLEDLATIPNLEVLYLQTTNVSGANLEPLGRMSRLVQVHVSGPLDDAAVANLSRASSLRLLRISNSPTDETQLAALKRALPQCRIEWTASVGEP